VTLAPLTVDLAARRAMIAHARTAHPRECCGLLVGWRREVRFVVPVRNVAASPTRFRLDDRAHLELRRVLRSWQPRLEIVGVYHSHPAGPAWPSATDVTEAHYPDWAFVVVGLGGRRPTVAAFSIRRATVVRWPIRWRGARRLARRQ
jgi:proteasome lid subunit RPN8/RPN11